MNLLYYDAVVFDLDGTLIDSAPGIIDGWRYTFSKLGREIPPDDILKKLIGPSLTVTLPRYFQMDAGEIDRVVAVYRPRYLECSWRLTRLFPGVRAVMKALHDQGAKVYVATGKPQSASENILRLFRLTPYIDGFAGVGDRELGLDKPGLIQRAMQGRRYTRVAMIGDYMSDIEAARALGFDGIGVTYGFGAKDEFAGAGCPVADSPEALLPLLMDAPPARRGYFISIEGLDGCGKTTQSDAIERILRDQGYTVRRTREPGGCPIAEKIRDLLLDVGNAGMTDITEALLYAASRAQHVRQVIRPAIARGEIVLCDRFVDSSVAFQGGGRALGVPLIQQINAPAIDGCMPDATVYLRLDHETALRRRANASALDRIESETASFHARVEAAYDALAAQDPARFITVEAKKAPEALTQEIMGALLDRLDAAGVV